MHACLIKCRYLKKVVTDCAQIVVVEENVVVEINFNTSGFIGLGQARLGCCLDSSIGDRELFFEENTITGYRQFDEFSLRFCRYLNLRCSSVDTLLGQYFSNLIFIDISFSQIKGIDLNQYTQLQKVVIDYTQVA